MKDVVSGFEREPKIYGPLTKEQAEQLSYDSLLEQDMEHALSGEMPEEVEREINETFLEESTSANQDDEDGRAIDTRSSADDEELAHEWVCKEFPSIESTGSEVRILIRNSATIGDNFKTMPGCLIGRKAVIGDNCKSSSPIHKKVKLGDNTTLSAACRIGVNKPHLDKGEEFQVEIGSNVFVDMGVKISPRSVIGNRTFIAPSVTIGSNAEKKNDPKYTVLGNDCVIQDASAIENGVNIGERCWIGKNCEVKSGASLGNDCWIQDGVVVEKDAIIGNGYIIRSGTKIPKGMTIENNDSNKQIVIDEIWISRHKARKYVK